MKGLHWLETAVAIFFTLAHFKLIEIPVMSIPFVNIKIQSHCDLHLLANQKTQEFNYFFAEIAKSSFKSLIVQLCIYTFTLYNNTSEPKYSHPKF